MSEGINSTELKSDGWRALLPARWLPIFVFVGWVAALFSLLLFLPDSSDSPLWPLTQLAAPLIVTSLFPIFAITAMSRAPIWLRLVILFGIPLVILAVQSTLPHLRYPSFASMKAASADFLEALPRQVNFFAFIAIAPHLLTSLFGADVTARAAPTSQDTSARRSTIKDWLYFMTLVGLWLMPEPTVVRSLLQAVFHSWFENLFADLALILMVTLGCMIISFTVIGTIMLAPFSAWRFQLLALLGLLVLIGTVSIYLGPRDSLATFKMISLHTLASAPHWLFMRWAGYRLVWGKAKSIVS